MALREILAEFGFKIDDAGLLKAQTGVENLIKAGTGLKSVVTGALAGLGLAGIKGEIDEIANEAGELRKASAKLGVGFQELQRLQAITGLGTEQLSTAFRGMSRTLAAFQGQAGEAESDFADLDGGLGKSLGTKQATDTIKALGVEFDDASGKAKSQGELFQDFAQAIGKIEDPNKRTAVAMRIFGRAGQDLLPFFSKSKEEIAAAAEQFELFGGFTDEAAAKLKEYSKEQKKLDQESKALKIAVLTELVPALTWLFETFNKSAVWIKKNIETNGLLRTAIVILTTAVIAYNAAALAAAVRSAAAWAAVVLPVALLILFIDDLVHFLKGDANSATEEFIKKLLGVKDATELIKELRDSFRVFTSDLENAKSSGAKLLVVLEGIVDAVNKIGQLSLDVVYSKISGKSFGDSRKTLESRSQDERPGNAIAVAEDIGKNIASNFAKTIVGGPLFAAVGSIKDSFSPGKSPTVAPISVPIATVDQKVQITQNIYGSDAKDSADQSKDGVKGVLANERRATLAAVKAQK